MSYVIERVVNNQTNGVLFIFGGYIMAIRYKSGILDEHLALAI